MYKLKKNKFKNSRNSPMLLLGLILIIVVVTVLSTIYLYKLKEIMQNESNKYLSEISSHVSELVDNRLKQNFSHVESTSSSIERMSNTSEEDKITFLKEESTRYNYIRMGISDINGNVKNSDGTKSNLLKEDFFQDALKGKQSISALKPSPIDNSEGIIYAVPLYKNEKISGVITAFTSKDKLIKSLSIESFNGEGYSQIIDGAGNYIVNSENKNAPKNPRNFFRILESKAKLDKGFSINEIKSLMSNKASGFFRYSLDNTEKNLTFTPLSIEDWYVLSIVPSKTVTAKTNIFIKDTILIVSTVIIMFLILIALILSIQRKNQNKLEHLAFVDPVTLGPNSTRFEIDACEKIKNSPKGSYAIVSMDIKKFKLINDSFGSSEGNKTLEYVYNIIQKHLEEDELAARITADNFNILLKYSSKDTIINRLDNITKYINEYNGNTNKKYYLTFSEGVYVIDDPSIDIITIQDRANVARKSKKTKSTGFHSCVFYSDLERIRMINEKEIENKMESALEKNEFIVYLQPKYSLKTSNISGAEALVRWQDSEKGIIPPGEFIPVFEQNGFIVDLDLYVFEKVCEKLRHWIDGGVTPLPISVNLSRIHLDNPNFLDRFTAISGKYNVPPNLIEIELTETVMFENMEELIRVIDQIHKIGFSCSLDDFGSGYSSLNILKDIPVDVLKLDKAFFSDTLDENNRGNHIVESVIDLAKKLNMQTVSEGVETTNQLNFLKGTKCDLVQGYVFSKPIPINEFELLAYGKNI